MSTPTCHRISEREPEFPCYLWANQPTGKGIWWRCSTRTAYHAGISSDGSGNSATHWHPDQPTAPDCAPGEETLSELEANDMAGMKCAGQHPLQQMPTPPPAHPHKEAAERCADEINNGRAFLQDSALTHEMRTQRLATIIRRHFPAQPVAPSNGGAAYPNIEAIACGTISGRFSEWPFVKSEAVRLLADLATAQRELAEARAKHAALLEKLSDRPRLGDSTP